MAMTLAVLDTLLQSVPVGLALLDTDLRFVRVNASLASFTGALVRDHAGRRLSELVPALAESTEPLLRRAVEAGASTVDARVTGAGRAWLLSCYPVRSPDGTATTGVGLVLREVTEQQRTADELATRAQHLEAVAAFGQRALIADDLDGPLSDITESLLSILGTEFVHVLEHDPDRGVFELLQSHGLDAEVGTTLPDDVTVQPGYALHHRMPVVVDDMGAESRFSANPLLEGTGAVSGMAVVIRGPGRPFGVIGTYTCTPRQFRPEEVDFVQSMANVLGTAVVRYRSSMALRSERERLRLALDAGGMGDWQWDLANNRLSLSPSLERIFGLEPGAFPGAFDDYIALLHPADRPRTLETIRAAVAAPDDTPFSVEHRVPMPEGNPRWIMASGKMVRDSSGTAVGMIGIGADITARVEAEFKQAVLFAGEQEARAEAERARDQLAFLAQASEVLASSLDYRATLSQVAHLAVSRLADWCMVDVLEDEDADAPTTVVVAHVDPARVALAADYRARYPIDPERDTGVMGVFRSGEPLVTPVITDEMLVGAAIDVEQLELLRELGLQSTLMVPLIARGRTVGVITMISAESGRIYGEHDLALAMDLSRRAAVAIDNARLYRERSQVAEALQRSLLPPRSPEIAGMEVAVRYRPVGRGTEIGGDFYDVFETTPGTWSVVIGDVCGKGTAAAAVTGLARDTVRGVSIREDSPARVLQVLNEVLLRRDEDESRFLTVALARVEPGASAGSAVHFRVACGGHPLPLVVRADSGAVEEAGRPGLLLGLFPEVDPQDVDVELRPGDLVVFYTDGVIEEQGPEGMFGEERLKELLASLGTGAGGGASGEVDAEVVAQAVLDALGQFAPGPPQDDVAIVVLRVPPSA
jgi:PAS domain S-box-containing protein